MDSVIQALSSDQEFKHSSALAHAYVLRAQVHLDIGDFSRAIDDAFEATNSRQYAPKAWRTLADTYERIGDTSQALKALQQWALCEPSLKSKVNKEIRRLQQLM